jgi:hypothetical protein
VYVEYSLSIGAAEAFRRPVTVAAIARSCDRAKASDASERGSRIASSSCEEEEEEEDARPSAAWAGERPARRTDAGRDARRRRVRLPRGSGRDEEIVSFAGTGQLKGDAIKC